MKDLRNTLQSKLESLADEGQTNTLREMYVCLLEMEGAQDLKLEELIFQRMEAENDPMGGILFVTSLLLETGDFRKDHF